MSDDDIEELFEQVSREAHELLKKTGGPVKRVSVRAGEAHIEIEWDPTAAPPLLTGGMPAAGAPLGQAVVGDGAGADLGTVSAVTAPLVGTFYSSPEPGAKPFVEVGDVVEPGQEVGIIEAMKIMNRIVSDVSGKIAEIVVTDGDMVEFGQKLMLVEPQDAE